MDFVCRRYGCLPSQVLEEDAYLLRMLSVLELAGQHGAAGDGPEPYTSEL